MNRSWGNPALVDTTTSQLLRENHRRRGGKMEIDRIPSNLLWKFVPKTTADHWDLTSFHIHIKDLFILLKVHKFRQRILSMPHSLLPSKCPSAPHLSLSQFYVFLLMALILMAQSSIRTVHMCTIVGPGPAYQQPHAQRRQTLPPSSPLTTTAPLSRVGICETSSTHSGIYLALWKDTILFIKSYLLQRENSLNKGKSNTNIWA